MYTDSEGILHLDTEQNYELIDIYTHDVIVTISRKYDTCDNNDYLIDVRTVQVNKNQEVGRKLGAATID